MIIAKGTFSKTHLRHRDQHPDYCFSHLGSGDQLLELPTQDDAHTQYTSTVNSHEYKFVHTHATKTKLLLMRCY